MIHLWNLDAPSSGRFTADVLVEAQRIGCGSVQSLVQALGDNKGSGRPRLWVVTAGAQPAGTSHGPLSLAQTPVWGLGRSVALEHPGLWGGLIDVDPADLTAGVTAVADEVLTDRGEDQVAFRGGIRFVARLRRRQSLEHIPSRLPLRAEGTYLVTGGLGELGLRVARRLVEQGARRIVLVGRRGLPGRSEWNGLSETSAVGKKVAAVRTLEKLGATVFVAATDVADSEAMTRLFSELRRIFPPIRGVIHAAGVIESDGVQPSDFEAFAGVLRPKLAGTWVLHEQTAGEPLDFLVAFSSVASVLGAKEAGYAAANHFLDAFAHHRRALGLPALTVNWGPWEGVGMAADRGRARAFGLLGVKPLRIDDGLDALSVLVVRGMPQAVVADVDWDTLIALYNSNKRRPLLDDLADRPIAGRHRQRGVNEFEWRGQTSEESRERLLKYLRGRLAEVLKLDPTRVDTERPIDTMGLDSLMAIELKNAVETDLGAPVSLASLLQGPTLEDLAGQMLDQLDDPDASGKPGHSIQITPEIAYGTSESPLSYGQRALWSLHQFSPESTAYNMVGAVRITGSLDLEALRRSAQRLVDRHASLRTTFLSHGGEPIQVVHTGSSVAFKVEDVTGASDTDLSRRLNDEANQPFDLENGPLFRIRLFRKSGSEHSLLLALHHIVADFWSIAILLDELGKIYPEELVGNVSSLPALTVTYADFGRWQSAIVEGKEGEGHWSYWQGQLAGPLPVSNLPTDRPRPAVQTARGAARLAYIDGALAARLSALGLRRGASLYTTLLAAFQVVLSRIGGQEDVIVGSPVVGRNRPELAGVVGYFVNPLPIRSKVESSLKFVDFLDLVRATVLGALDHQDIPFAALADRFQTVRDPSRSPIFQVMFVLQKAQRLEEKGFTAFALGGEGTRTELCGFPVESIALETRAAQFDLTVQIAEEAGRLAVSAVYNTDLHDAGSIDRLLGHYLTLLEAVADDPERVTTELPLLTRAEADQFAHWNETRENVPADATFPSLFERHAAERPERIAVAAGDGLLTYGELNARANRLSRRLRRLGVGAGVRVAVCAERSCLAVVGILGVLKAGGAYVPLDPDYPADRLAFMIDDCRAHVLLTQDRLLGRIPASGARVVSLEEELEEIDLDLDPIAEPDDLAYVIYTSGSTGTPRAFSSHEET